MSFQTLFSDGHVVVKGVEIEGLGCLINSIHKDSISSIFIPNVKILDGKLVSASPAEPLFDMLSQLRSMMENSVDSDDETKH